MSMIGCRSVGDRGRGVELGVVVVIALGMLDDPFNDGFEAMEVAFGGVMCVSIG